MLRQFCVYNLQPPRELKTAKTNSATTIGNSSVSSQQGFKSFYLFGISIKATKNNLMKIFVLSTCAVRRGVLFHIRRSLMVQSRYNSQYLFNVTKRKICMYRGYISWFSRGPLNTKKNPKRFFIQENKGHFRQREKKVHA
jgi:hypothetical protein